MDILAQGTAGWSVWELGLFILVMTNIILCLCAVERMIRNHDFDWEDTVIIAIFGSMLVPVILVRYVLERWQRPR